MVVRFRVHVVVQKMLLQKSDRFQTNFNKIWLQCTTKRKSLQIKSFNRENYTGDIRLVKADHCQESSTAVTPQHG